MVRVDVCCAPRQLRVSRVRACVSGVCNISQGLIARICKGICQASAVVDLRRNRGNLRPGMSTRKTNKSSFIIIKLVGRCFGTIELLANCCLGAFAADKGELLE